MKKIQFKSCLINIFVKLNKFIPNNWFGKTIIILNQNNINPFANIKFNKFF